MTPRLNLIKACTILVLAIAVMSAAQAANPPAQPANPPKQPATGPGGAQYSHSSVVVHKYGQGDLEYWLFEPAKPQTDSAPVVIFNHGWSAVRPNPYQAWIDHIVRRGNIVIYPRYQATLLTPPSKFCSNAIAATKDALSRLQKEPGHVHPQLDKIAAVGHSAGAQISPGMAAHAATDGLPPIKAVMAVEPGKTTGPKRIQIPLENLSAMPASTLLLAVVGDRDNLVRDDDAIRIINESILVPAQNKNFVTIVSDLHGTPPLIANHFCPTAPEGDLDPSSSSPVRSNANRSGPVRRMIKRAVLRRLAAQRDLPRGGGAETIQAVNALDYYGIWKLCDALVDAAFYGKEREYALGDTPQQRYMGKWSDGVPVKELVVEVGHASADPTRIKGIGSARKR